MNIGINYLFQPLQEKRWGQSYYNSLQKPTQFVTRATIILNNLIENKTLLYL